MRGLVLVALVIACAACGDDDSGSGRGGTRDAAPQPDTSGPVCTPSGLCSMGVQCGPGCCQPGEQCVEGTCMCGSEPACASGDYCTSGGPAQPTHGCGLFCCGPVSGVGCPI